MLDSRTSQMHRRRRLERTLLLAFFLASTPNGPTLAGERTHRVQGVFCNAEAQIDETLGHMSRSLAPSLAVALTNTEGVVCTHVDLLHYVVEQPLITGEIPGAVPLTKYEAMLVGVEVGGELRPVSPPVRIFFISTQRLAGAVAEERA